MPAVLDKLKTVAAGVVFSSKTHWLCPACEQPVAKAKEQLKPSKSKSLTKQPSLSFSIWGCGGCGHIARWMDDNTIRDLTKAEADELAASAEWSRIRERVAEAHTDKWG